MLTRRVSGGAQWIAGSSPAMTIKLFSAELRQAFAQIVAVHDRNKVDLGVEIEKERFDQFRDLRSVGHVKKDHAATHAVQCREISGLRLKLAHDRFHRS